MYYTNVRELLAAYFALKRFKSDVKNKHIELMIDNTTAVAVINHMGTNYSNEFAMKIRSFCFVVGGWLYTETFMRLTLGVECVNRNIVSSKDSMNITNKERA